MNCTSSNKMSIYLAVIALVSILVTGCAFTYIYFQTQTQLVSLQEGYEELRSRLESLSIASGTGLEAHQIYVLVENSVVQVMSKKIGENGLEPEASGTGFTYDADGHIVTNNHVIEDADSVEVTFLDGATVKASIVGTDPYSDLAVLKVQTRAERLKPVILGDSSKLLVGEKVYAVGAPFGLSWSLTQGIVSQIGRTLPASGGYSIPGVIQVDAAINPGNSGGPLVNRLGEVVGVNTAIQSETGVFSGVGFAIPSNLLRLVVPSLIRTGSYEHAWIGVAGSDVTPSIAEKMGLPEARGFLVISVVEGGPAERAGIRGGERVEIIEGRNMSLGGDVITHIDGKVVRKLEDLLTHLEYSKRPGEVAVLEIIREGKTTTLTVTLGTRPPPSSP
ncbi:trypsin-like peptidase domain-containing protein [Candidatus Bathyarchaeota archaeon]|nr:trypsin-like peptidase domain-containing protein [Candidatus Bathyarchaeota archaeon]